MYQVRGGAIDVSRLVGEKRVCILAYPGESSHASAVFELTPDEARALAVELNNKATEAEKE